MPMTTEQVAELFPNLMDISDADLRDKVAAVWCEAIQTGCGGKGWTTDELRAVPFTLLAGDIDLRYIEHLNSCAKQCIAIAGVLQEVFKIRLSTEVGMESLECTKEDSDCCEYELTTTA